MRNADISSRLTGERKVQFAKRVRVQRVIIGAVALMSIVLWIILPLAHIDLREAPALRIAMMILFAAIISTCVYVLSYYKTNQQLLVEEMGVKEPRHE